MSHSFDDFDAPNERHVAHNGIDIPIKYWSGTGTIISVMCTMVYRVINTDAVNCTATAAST